MAHDRKLVLGGVSLTEARPNRFGIEVMEEIRDELESVLISSGFLTDAPFKWVGLILRYGLRTDSSPKYQRISKKHGDLPISIEVDVNEMIGASRDELKQIMKKVTLLSLIHVGERYDLPTRELVEIQSEIGERFP